MSTEVRVSAEGGCRMRARSDSCESVVCTSQGIACYHEERGCWSVFFLHLSAILVLGAAFEAHGAAFRDGVVCDLEETLPRELYTSFAMFSASLHALRARRPVGAFLPMSSLISLPCMPQNKC